MKIECAECGADCSHAYGTHNGLPYHFGCIPAPRRRSLTREETAIMDEALFKSTTLVALAVPVHLIRSAMQHCEKWHGYGGAEIAEQLRAILGDKASDAKVAPAPSEVQDSRLGTNKS